MSKSAGAYGSSGNHDAGPYENTAGAPPPVLAVPAEDLVEDLVGDLVINLVDPPE